jgi:hypothetical protein
MAYGRRLCTWLWGVDTSQVMVLLGAEAARMPCYGLTVIVKVEINFYLQEGLFGPWYE